MSDSTSSDQLVRPGRIVAGKYEVLRVLGEGGAGIVVAARHVVLNRLVALKFLRAPEVKLSECIESFASEARAMFDIANEHIVRVFDLDTLADGTPFMVMELLDGSDLRRQIAAHRVFAPAYVIELGRQICDGLAAAHAGGVIHRDIKPENIFVTAGRDGAVKFKLLDFGISRASARTETRRRRSGLTSGTPAYMSPEQVRASPDYDSRTDIWSLGCVLYEMLTGASPFEGSTPEQCCAAVLDKRPAPIRVHRPELDPRLESIVMRCLSKQPRLRFSSALELRTALTLWACTTVAGIPEVRPPPTVSAARSDSTILRQLETVVYGKRLRRHVPSALLAIGGGICLTVFSAASCEVQRITLNVPVASTALAIANEPTIRAGSTMNWPCRVPSIGKTASLAEPPTK